MRKKYNKKIGYYVCSRKGCKYNSATVKVHEAYYDSLNSLSLSDELTELLKTQLILTFNNQNKESKEMASSIQNSITQKKRDLEIAETNFALSTNTRSQGIIMKTIDKLNKEIKDLSDKLEKVKIELLNPEKFIEYGLDMRNKLLEMWMLQDIGRKRQLQNLIHPEGFTFNKSKGFIEPKKVNMFLT